MQENELIKEKIKTFEVTLKILRLYGIPFYKKMRTKAISKKQAYANVSADFFKDDNSDSVTISASNFKIIN